MKISLPLPCRAAVGPVRVIGAAFAAVMLTALAQPVAANPLSAQSNAPYEGHDLEITFTNAWPQNIHLRYKYKTADGSATGSGRWQDYEPTSGYVTWSPRAVNAQEAVTVETVQDQLCEYDETFKVILIRTRVQYQLVCVRMVGLLPQQQGPSVPVRGGGHDQTA